MTFAKGHKKTGGRVKGQVNKLTDEVRKLAKDHGKAAIAKLADLMENSQDDRAKVAAAKELLDRAYGKSSGIVQGDESGGPIRVTIIGDDAKL